VWATTALPGWQIFIGTEQINYVSVDDVDFGYAMVSVFDGTHGPQPLPGKYSVGVYAGLWGRQFDSASISQTGTVPAGTQSIEMDVVESGGTFTVSMNGQTVKMIPLQTTLSGYTIYGGNIPSRQKNRPSRQEKHCSFAPQHRHLCGRKMMANKKRVA
jgi:hypothetical protein